MLNISRYPGQSIILEYGNILEFLYYKYDHIKNEYYYQIYVNHILKLETQESKIEFIDDGLYFDFYIEGREDKGLKHRVIMIDCPDFVHIRRKELPPREKIA